MATHETQLAIQAKVLGAQKAAADLDRIGKAMKDPDALKALEAFGKQQKVVNDMIANGASNTEAFAKQLQRLGRMTRDMKELQRTMADIGVQSGQLSRAQARGLPGMQQGGRQGMVQGLLQGMGMRGVFLQRGAGFPQQLMGFAGGRMARLGGGMLRAPFIAGRGAGMAGMGGAMAGGLGLVAGLLPLVADVAKSQIQAGLDNAQRTLSVRQQFQQVTAMTGGAIGIRPGREFDRITAQIAAKSEELRVGRERAMTQRQYGQRAAEEARKAIAEEADIDLEARALQTTTGGVAEDRPGLTLRTAGEEAAEPFNRTARAIESVNTQLEEQIEELQSRARVEQDAPRTSMLQRIIEEGAQFGLSREQAIQVAGQAGVAQRGPLMEETARVAMTARQFGADPSVSGLLGRGIGIEQGFRGKRRDFGGRMEQAFANTVRDAMAAGLEGSEIADFMKAIAENTAAIRETGVKFDRGAFGELTRALSGGKAGTGIAPQQALALTQGLTRGAQRIGFEGPRDASDLIAMRTVGRLAGTDPVSVFRSMARMQEQPPDPQMLRRMIEQHISVMRGAAGAKGMSAEDEKFFEGSIAAMTLQRFTGQRIGFRFGGDILRQLRSPGMTPEKLQNMLFKDAQDEAKKGIRTPDTAVQVAADIATGLQESGNQLLESVENLAKTQENNLALVGEFGSAINMMTELMLSASHRLRKNFGSGEVGAAPPARVKLP